MKLTVIVPIYNEARILEAVLRRLMATPEPDEIIVLIWLEANGIESQSSTARCTRRFCLNELF